MDRGNHENVRSAVAVGQAFIVKRAGEMNALGNVQLPCQLMATALFFGVQVPGIADEDGMDRREILAQSCHRGD